MTPDSLLKIYVGNKFIGSHFPILVVVGDNTYKNTPFGEHYVFTDVPELPFVARRDVISPENARLEYFNFDAYPELFSAESLLNNQLIAARAHLEFSLSTLNKQAHKEIFWEGRVFEFTECDDSPFVQFKAFGKYKKEMTAMFEFTRSRKLEALEEKLKKIPKLKVEHQTSDEEK